MHTHETNTAAPAVTAVDWLVIELEAADEEAFFSEEGG